MPFEISCEAAEVPFARRLAAELDKGPPLDADLAVKITLRKKAPVVAKVATVAKTAPVLHWSRDLAAGVSRYGR